MGQIPSDVLEYVLLKDMTNEEKKTHPEAETTGGYLKKINNSNSAVIWWHGLSDEKKEVVKAIPNFSPEIFKEITGIDVNEEGDTNQ